MVFVVELTDAELELIHHVRELKALNIRAAAEMRTAGFVHPAVEHDLNETAENVDYALGEVVDVKDAE